MTRADSPRSLSGAVLGAEVSAQVATARQLLDQTPPNTAHLILYRYRYQSWGDAFVQFVGEGAEDIVFDLLDGGAGGEGDTSRARPKPRGLELRWVGSDNTLLHKQAFHPVEPEFEDSILPDAFRAAIAAQAHLAIYVENPQAPALSEQWFPGTKRSAAARGVNYREAAQSTDFAAREFLITHGWDVTTNGDLRISHMALRKAQPWLLLFALLAVFFMIILVPALLSAPCLLLPYLLFRPKKTLAQIWNVFRLLPNMALKNTRDAIRSSTHRVELRRSDDQILWSESTNGTPTNEVSQARHDVLDVGFGTVSYSGESKKGRLRLITQDRVVTLGRTPFVSVRTWPEELDGQIGNALAHLLRQTS